MGLHVPGDLVVFDWHGNYTAEGVSPSSNGKVVWTTLVPGDPGLVITCMPGSSKPYVGLFGRQNAIVRLSDNMVKHARPRSVPPASL
mgnify:FL=1